MRQPTYRRPVAPPQQRAAQFEVDEGPAQGLTTGKLARDPVRLVLAAPCEHERVRVEVRRKPLEKPLEQSPPVVPRLVQALQEPPPGRADPIDPRPEPAVVTRQVSELVRQHRPELVRGQPSHERQAELQIVLIPAERAEPRALGDCGVPLGGEQDVVESRAGEPASQLLHHGEQRWSLGARDLDAVRARKTHPQGAQDRIGEQEQRPAELEERVDGNAGDGSGQPHEQGQEPENQGEHQPDVGVPEQSQQAEPDPVGHGMQPRVLFGARHQGVVALPRHTATHPLRPLTTGNEKRETGASRFPFPVSRFPVFDGGAGNRTPVRE